MARTPEATGGCRRLGLLHRVRRERGTVRELEARVRPALEDVVVPLDVVPPGEGVCTYTREAGLSLSAVLKCHQGVEISCILSKVEQIDMRRIKNSGSTVLVYACPRRARNKAGSPPGARRS
jgi:hypothetical protein